MSQVLLLQELKTDGAPDPDAPGLTSTSNCDGSIFSAHCG